MIERTSGRPLARDAMAYVLAGGRGSRLMELTDRRAKPAVYFGGKTRIIDFALSNALNSGIRRIGVADYRALLAAQVDLPKTVLRRAAVDLSRGEFSQRHKPRSSLNA